MDKPISRRAHGFTDFSYVPLVAFAPRIVGFQDDKTPATLCEVFSCGILGSALFTRAEWGAIRVIPFKVHLVLDVTAGLTALSSPWLFGFAQNKRARNTFVAMGVFSLLAGLLSKPNNMPKQK